MVGGVEGMVGAYCGTGRGKKGGDRIVLFTAGCGWVATLVDGSLVGTEAGTHGVGEKKIRFWQKRSPNCDFFYFIVLLSCPLLKIYDGWVQREGKTDPIWAIKIFNSLRSKDVHMMVRPC
jgi:hypothetical protein